MRSEFCPAISPRLTAVVAICLAAMVWAGCGSTAAVEPAPALDAAIDTPQAGGGSVDLDSATRPESANAAAAHRPAQPFEDGDDGSAGTVDGPSAALLDAEERARLKERREAATFRFYIDQGRAYRNSNQYEEALRAFGWARDLRPDNEEANRLYDEMLALLNRAPGSTATELRDASEADRRRVSEAQAVIDHLIRNGQDAMDRNDYARAISLFQQARDIAQINDGRMDAAATLRMLDSLMDEAAAAREARIERELEESRQLSRALEEVEKKNQIEAWREDIKALYESAQADFERERYEECLVTLSKILWKDPYNEDVLKLQQYCLALSYEKRDRELQERTRREWERTIIELKDAATPVLENPLTGAAQFPSIEQWRQVEQRRIDVARRTRKREDPKDLAVKQALRTRTVNLVNWDEEPLSRVLEFINRDIDIKILRTQEIRELDDDLLVTTDAAQNMRLDAALQTILDQLEDTDYYIKEGIIFIGTIEEAEEGRHMPRQVFDVKDLLGAYRNFPGEEIQLEDQDVGFGAGQDEPDVRHIIELEPLLDTIMEVMPTAWEAERSRLVVGPNGTLVAVNTPEVLAEVEAILSDLRQSRGLMVTIECRLLEVQDNFLEEIGIDYRGASGIPPGAVGPNLTAAPLDEFQFGINAATQFNNEDLVIGRDNTVGIYWSNAPDSEVRTRIENMFDRALGDSDSIQATGGASFQFAFLDEIQLNAVLRAVKKRERVSLVTAPKITCFNTQRANLTVRTQIAYISDFDVQAQQNVSIADPVVDTIEDGLILEVRPVISADRRYITVETKPTIALLKRPLRTLTTTLGAAGSTPVTIQLPELLIQRIRTTVTVPDGGSFLIGGVRRQSDTTLVSTVPLIGDLPIIGNLFKRRGKSLLRSDLVIVVKAKITDLREAERMVYPSDLTTGGVGR
jgi:tetratricopeptide (TPR) repeat protein